MSSPPATRRASRSPCRARDSTGAATLGTAYCGSRHCVGVGSGLAAIELGLRAAGIGPGDEVIVPAYTWIATWLGVSAAGATPVGVDVEASTYNLDPGRVEAAITPRTAAILPVHLLGRPVDMGALAALGRAHGLLVVEDAAQAHGARIGGDRVGGLGDLGACAGVAEAVLDTVSH
ncbi:MAG: DegT/DnrJ/EryC1/StrS family aminotransferase [Solirubrobacterales bacterium]